jgi:Zn-dependent peptidase ImmA (M78 family)
MKVKILANDVMVKLVDSVPNPDGEAYGMYEERESTIYLMKSASKQVLQDTVLHEILHAILQAYEKDNEKLVRLVTPALLAVIKDNPELVLFLQS